ncbi:MAG: UvrD-helicase domain-containing protein [Halomonas sp.]|uniref:UvrD-helicase domain-containing protein n=1 Tax=Halomonas sp. TaxID=1486246 RepID=UPI0028700F0D|nr:UvrD-helicase domain-containing protein [Halomonas sp.]MDR9438506.1 UvrD-helicase domain-containing protein [Halomonas sp.]
MSAPDQTPPTLDPIHLSLTGSRLIEASAGTGKTFTIALLYVRLVLGPRDEADTASFPRALTPPEILVVTFTNAATRELRDRIRARLVEAADAFLAQNNEAPGAGFDYATEGAPGADRRGGPTPGTASVAPREGVTAPPRRSAAGSAPSMGATSEGEIDDLFAEPPVDNSEAVDKSGGDPPGGDPLIALRDSYPRESWPACARRLQLAAEWMDEAAVSTIHAWCHRMLREHAFESGSLFSLEMNLDQSELELEVARDYWRSFYYALDADALAVVTRYWETPDALAEDVRRLQGDADLLPDAPPPAGALAAMQAERARMLASLKAPWPAWVDELARLFDEGQQAKAFNGSKMRKDHRSNWLDKLREWATTDMDWPDLDRKAAAWHRLTPAGIAEIWKGEPPDHPAFTAFEALPEQLKTLPDAHADLLAHAVHWMSERRERMQQRRAELGPDDLLERLDRAFVGDAGEALAAHVRRQFPVALVDEFQDTDPVQYRLFDHVYRLAEAPDPAAPSGILLIGDPKQAIYAFRGADIHTYLQARRDTAGRHVTLGTNFRSATAMVEAVNRVFRFAESHPAGRGAFLFRKKRGQRERLDQSASEMKHKAHGAQEARHNEGLGELSSTAQRSDSLAQPLSQVLENPVPFLPVKAKGRKDALTRDGAPLPAMTLWHLESQGDAAEGMNKGAYFKEMAARCATRMAELLCEGQQGRTGFGEPGKALRALKPSDLAVLVNNAGEAKAIRGALLERGIKSVYLSDKEGVFETPAALELEVWLAACGEPDSERRLHAALAMPSLGMGLHDLDALQHDELAWEERVLQFRAYHRQWQRQGVLPMLHRLLADFAVPTRLLKSASGERHLTDLLHLGELLQEASAELDGEHALLRHLSEARAQPPAQADTHRLRLESDADLVQVITIHKSKGLEYPLVFLPFICAFREKKASDLPLTWHDDQGRRHLSLEADDTVLARADDERLGEDLRKLYVALTRARHATWLGIAPLKGLERSAIGQVLTAGAPLSPKTLGEALAPLITEAGGNEGVVEIVPAPAPRDLVVPIEQNGEALREALTPARRAREHWWIASYSALRRGGERIGGGEEAPETALSIEPETALAKEEPETALEATAREMRDEPQDPAGASMAVSEASLHLFPRGPAAGTFLHGLLEWAGHEGFEALAADPERLDDTLARRANLRGWRERIPALQAWLRGLLTSELPVPSAPEGPVAPLRLAELASTRYQVELEFWFAAHQVDTARLDALVSAHTLGGAARPALERDRLNGMLKGFIDLVVEHEGRFYVLDWKSNHLGRDDEAYAEAAMAEAVREKRYDLQYCLYLLALHRLLKSRLPDYDIDRHLGGALYVFLRGQHAPSRGVHRERPPRELIEQLDALFRAPEAQP